MLKQARAFLNYASQVRLFALLLLLLLVVLLIGIIYLFGQAKFRLEREQEQKLRLLGSVSEQILSGAGWARGTGALPAGVASALLNLKNQARVHRLILRDRSGGELTIGRAGPPFPPFALVEKAWVGVPVLSSFYQDEAGGYYRAFLLPLKGEAGVTGLLIVEEKADFLGWLERFRWAMLLGYGSGLVAALVLLLLFVRSILKPYMKLSSTARAFTRLHHTPPPEEGGEMEFVVSAFQQMINALQEQQAELARLYAAEQKRARDLQSYQEYILGSISSGVISLKPDLSITVFNRTAQQIFGFSEAEVLGRSCREIFGEEGEMTRLAEDALKNQRIHSRLELCVKGRGGEAIWIGLNSSLLRDEDGNVVGLTFLLTDLTEVLKLREQVMLKESLATLGQMSAGIAHEFRNSLGAILGFAKLLQKKLPSEDPCSAHARDIVAECRSLETILKDFLAFAKPEKLQPAEVDLAALIRECLESYREKIEGARVRVQLNSSPEGLRIQADPLALKQAFTNLIRNAFEAMPEGGELKLEVRAKGQMGDDPSGRWAEVIVTDSGPGIPPEDRERIFTPFFTTKEGGTGLGLALVQKAVLSHGGRVEVESQVGVGSAFRILLPYGERPRSPRL